MITKSRVEKQHPLKLNVDLLMTGGVKVFSNWTNTTFLNPTHTRVGLTYVGSQVSLVDVLTLALEAQVTGLNGKHN